MNHYFVIGRDRRRYGPVSVAELREWLQQGRITLDSPARPATEWQPLRCHTEFGPKDVPAVVAPATAERPLSRWAGFKKAVAKFFPR